MKVSTVGLDLAKNVFQVHAVDEAGEVIVRKALRRGRVMPFFEGLEPCLIGMKACGTSHYWGRELCALGHEVKLMPPAYVKAYVKRGKTDAGDAAAICEAVGRPSMRFVAIKSREQQSLLAVHQWPGSARNDHSLGPCPRSACRSKSGHSSRLLRRKRSHPRLRRLCDPEAEETGCLGSRRLMTPCGHRWHCRTRSVRV
jgi:hypothetical protein